MNSSAPSSLALWPGRVRQDNRASSASLRVFQQIVTGCSVHRIAGGCDEQSQVGQELGRVDGRGVGDIENVLISHLILGRQEETRRITKIDVVDERDDRADERRAVHAKSRCNFAGFTSINEY